MEGLIGDLDELRHLPVPGGAPRPPGATEGDHPQSRRRFEAKEDIYHKRHIAVDIPSVYGRYRERKFDALGLTFRLENLANIYLEKLPETVNLSFITRGHLHPHQQVSASSTCGP